MNELVARVIRIENSGCATGQVHSSQLQDHARRIGDGEKKFNWLIVLIITTLLGLVSNLFIGCANLTRPLILQNAPTAHSQEYPRP